MVLAVENGNRKMVRELLLHDSVLDNAIEFIQVANRQ